MTEQPWCSECCNQGGRWDPECQDQWYDCREQCAAWAEMDRVRTAQFKLRQASMRANGHYEVVICSAIRLPDGRIIRGHRHGDCIRTACEWWEWNGGKQDRKWNGSMCRDQGFISSRNRYVDREEGMRLQLAAGIESVADGGYRGDTLFSEDLYRS